MQDDDYGVLLFDSTQGALKAEKVLKKAGYLIKMIPVPRQISSDCGVCVRFLWKDRGGVESELRAAKVGTAGVHHLEQ